MQKTAREIADTVLEKVAISEGLARRALSSTYTKRLKAFAKATRQNTYNNSDQILSDITERHPRTVLRAYPEAAKEFSPSQYAKAKLTSDELRRAVAASHQLAAKHSRNRSQPKGLLERFKGLFSRET